MASTPKTSTRASSKTTKTKKKASKSRTSGSGGSRTVIPRTYSTVVRHLLERTNYERVRVVNYDEKNFKLDRMRKLLKRLGDPHLQVRTVHVAGTVGKGSTVSMLANMIQGCGFTVGTFTSPHLVEVTERICLNGAPIDETAFTKLMREVIKEADKTDKNITYFELLTAAALKHFAQHGLGAAREALNQAEQAHFTGDMESYAWWLDVCRTLDRRVAEDLIRRLDTTSALIY